MNNKSKLAWIYILDKCDHYGIYKVNIPLLNFQLTAKYKKDDLLEAFNGRIVCLTSDKWFIPKYITFQYGNIEASEGRMIKTVYNYLRDSDLLKHLNHQTTECQHSVNTPKSMDKDMDKDKDKERVADFFSYFLLKTKKKFRLSEERIKLIVECLKNHPIEDMKGAVDNFVQDTWEDRKKHMDLVHCIGTRGVGLNKVNNLEKWLNYDPKPARRMPS